MFYDDEDHMASCTSCHRQFDTRRSAYDDHSRCSPCWDRINNMPEA